MFSRILIANRGEIACRVIITAQSMGVECVAVFSDVDRDARHVQMADVAVSIGGAAPTDSYLKGDAIIAAAIHSGAQAIHPGYGFLSENPDFVEAVEAAGLVFIGPSASAIRAMGLKDAAKSLMVEAGVPVVRGYHGEDQTDARLATAADEIGYPVLIKAVAGGGGKGMRLVEEPGAFADALASARSEAKSAFGNSDVLVEKFVSNPRHIEVQIFGDGKRAVHLFERDCSLQRRHQKVIEEAPAPGMTQEVRAAMGQAAVRAAEAIGYSGAGTVEFIADSTDGLRPDGFYFMEMNARLQVEHPVTEAVTGVDLVEWQLRVAAGDPIPRRQEELSLNGHAFEARLYAEDVPAGFLPATGRLTHLAFPASARADTGVQSGDEISPFYDPMLAKLIVHGPTRDVALARLSKALSECEVAGTVTNLAFLGALAAHEGFAAGQIDTGLIAQDIETLTRIAQPGPEDWVAAGICALNLQQLPADAGITLWEPLVHRVSLRFAEEAHEISVQVLSKDAQRCEVPGAEVIVRNHRGQWRIGGDALPKAHKDGTRITVFNHFGLVFDTVDPLDRSVDDAAQGSVIVAPMPGLVKELNAQEGATVKKGDRLAVLEAMKMEHSLVANRDGHISEVLVRKGEQVSAGAVLIVLEEAET